MDQKEYLQRVMEQIRYEKAKPMISGELENHIADQKDFYVEDGMDEKEACQKAVLEMGDPVDVGIAMDRIHRPKMEWKMISLVLVLSVLGIGLQYVMCADMGKEVYRYDVNNQLLCMVAGFVVMFAFCFFDYTRIGVFAKGGTLFLLTLLLFSMTMGPRTNGQSGYIAFGGIYISLHLLMYLYIPFFGGVLYLYKNQGKRGLIKSMIWMIIPVFLSLRLPDFSLASSLFVIMMIQIYFVMKKGWFGQSKKGITLVASILIGCPIVLGLYFLLFGADYQRARITAIFSTSNEYNYQMSTARNILLGSNIIGKSADSVGGILPEVASDFILTYVFSYYGILVAAILLLVLVFFVLKVFKISLHQKNQLGLVIGMGCSLVFAVQISACVLVNMTIIPSMSVFLPFFSYGSTGTIVSYAIIGILLSIYRYQNLLPANPCVTKAVKSVKRLV